MSTDSPPGRGASEIDELIERSSFGTPGSRALSDRTPPELVRAILDRVAGTPDSGRETTTTPSGNTTATPTRETTPAPGRIRVTVVEEQRTGRASIADRLTSQPRVDLRESVSSLASSRLELEPPGSVVLCEAQLLDSAGLARVSELVRRRWHRVLVTLTGEPDPQLVFAAIRAGVLGFINADADEATYLQALDTLAQGRPHLSPEVAQAILDNHLLTLPRRDEEDLRRLASRELLSPSQVRLSLTVQRIFERLRTAPEVRRHSPPEIHAPEHRFSDDEPRQPRPVDSEHTSRDHPPAPVAMPNAAILVEASDLLRVLAAPARVAIVLQLWEGEQDVHELVTALGIAQPLLTQHLRVLKAAGVVRGERRGRDVMYQLVGQGPARLVTEAVEHVQEDAHSLS